MGPLADVPEGGHLMGEEAADTEVWEKLRNFGGQERILPIGGFKRGQVSVEDRSRPEFRVFLDRANEVSEFP